MQFKLDELAEARSIEITGTPEEIVDVLDAMGIAHKLEVIKPEPVDYQWWSAEAFKQAVARGECPPAPESEQAPKVTAERVPEVWWQDPQQLNVASLRAFNDQLSEIIGKMADEALSPDEEKWEQVEFDQIKPGMFIRHMWDHKGVVNVREGMVAEISKLITGHKVALNDREQTIASQVRQGSTYYRLRKAKLSDDLWRTIRYEDIKSGDMIRILRPSGTTTILSPADCMHSSGDWMTESQGFITYDPAYTYQRKVS